MVRRVFAPTAPAFQARQHGRDRRVRGFPWPLGMADVPPPGVSVFESLCALV
jgi:hypothetical protein